MKNDDVYRQMIAQVQDYAIIRVGLSGEVTSWNAGAHRIKGYAEDEIVGGNIRQFYTDADLEIDKPAQLLKLAATHGRAEDEGWRMRKDGSRFWASVSLTAIQDESESVIGFTKVTRDLTERHHAEETLRQSEARYRRMIDEVQDYAIILLDEQGNVLSWNAGAALIKGYRSDEIVGKSMTLFYPPEDQQQDRPRQLLDQARLEDRAVDEGWRIKKDGGRFWASVTITALQDDSGHVIGFSKVTRDLTDRVKAEEKVRRSEERFARMVAEVQDYAIIMLDTNGTVESWNAGAQRIKGYSADEIIGKSFRMFYSPEDKRDGKPGRLLKQALDQGRAVDEGPRLKKDGSTFWAHVTLTALHDDHGTAIGITKLTRDLTERKRAEEELLQHEQRFRNMVAEVREYAILLLSVDGEIESWNAGAQRIKGYKPDEIIGQHIRHFYTEDDQRARRPEQLLQKARVDGHATDEGLRVKKDGSTFWASVTITAIHHDSGHITGFSKVTRDLSAWKAAEEGLRQSEERYQRMVAEVSDYAIILLSIEGKVQTWNVGAARIKGYTADEIIGKSLHTFYRPEDIAAKKPEHLLEAARRTGRASDEGWRLRQDGSLFWASVVITALHNEYGETTSYSKVTRDMTEPRMAQEKLRRSEDRLNKMVSAVEDYAILLLSPEGDVETWNAGAEKIKGYTADDMIGRHFHCFYTDEDVAQGKPDALLHRAAQEGRANDEGWRVRKDGSRFWAAVSITALRDDAGDITGYSKLTRDLTERKAAEDAQTSMAEELRQRNNALDEFAYLTSHDLQEPLRTVKSFTRILNTNNKDALDDGGQEALSFINESVDRMSVMIRELLEHSRLGQISGREPVDCNGVVRAITSDLSVVIRTRNAQINYASLPTLHAYPTELRLLFQNLISNAIKFTPEDRDPAIAITAQRMSGYWQFAVADNGIGVEDKFRERIFKIFQRLHLRDEYEGVGIGLAHCVKIVQAHGGRIWVDENSENNAPGHAGTGQKALGSIFRFTIPDD